jgi:hypothetical protein
MPIPQPLVEIGFLLDDPEGDFALLDDPVKGVLGSPIYVLGGELFYDVTDKVSNISITRGKNRELDQYDPGLANVVFINNDRTFDPEFAGSPYFGQIVPKKRIRISSGGQISFTGVIDDWNLQYEPSGDSTVSAACSDATSFFSNQIISERTNEVQLSGERIRTILSLPTVSWPVDNRNIQDGFMELGADTIEANTSALSYMRQVTRSEPGSLFISKDNKVVFKDRRADASADVPLLADDSSGISYFEMIVEYGSENLFNEIIAASEITTTQIIVNAEKSIADYGIFSLSRTDLLINDDEDLAKYALLLANKFKDPEYRFQSVGITLNSKTPAEQTTLLALELGDVVRIKFTPNGIPPAIDKFAEIISIRHAVDSTNHILQFGFATLDSSAWRLSDAVFGRLSAGNSLAY